MESWTRSQFRWTAVQTLYSTRTPQIECVVCEGLTGECHCTSMCHYRYDVMGYEHKNNDKIVICKECFSRLRDDTEYCRGCGIHFDSRNQLFHHLADNPSHVAEFVIR